MDPPSGAHSSVGQYNIADGLIREWFLADFGRQCRQDMLPARARDCVRHMSRQLQQYEGLQLRQYMLSCWTAEAIPGFFRDFQGTFNEEFLLLGDIPDVPGPSARAGEDNVVSAALAWSRHDQADEDTQVSQSTSSDMESLSSDVVELPRVGPADAPVVPERSFRAMHRHWLRECWLVLLIWRYELEGRSARQIAQLVSHRRRRFNDMEHNAFKAMLRTDIGPLGCHLVEIIEQSLARITSTLATAEDCRNVRQTGVASHPAQKILAQQASLLLARRLRTECGLAAELADACTERFLCQLEGAGYWSYLSHLLRVLTPEQKQEFWAWFWKYVASGAPS